jgi:hypothetical protein
MSKYQRLALVALAVVLAVAAFAVLRPTDDEQPERASTPAPAETGPARTQREEAKPRPEVTKIRLRGGKPVGGPRTISLRSGQTGRIDISSDVPGEVHLHGFDIEKQVAPGRPARLRFKADIDGVFELEDHQSGEQIASVEVSPR